MISGRYVKTFREASHALPQGMHMSADYPFMLPAIRKIEGRDMTIVGDGGDLAIVRIRRKGDREVASIKQSSSFERIFRKRPQRFELHPFKDQNTPAAGE